MLENHDTAIICTTKKSF